MTHEQAMQLLQIEMPYSAAMIKAAFARRVKETHPDTAIKVVWPVTMQHLQSARDVLLEAAAALNRACKLCGGSGKIRSRVGMRSCSACAGTGDKQ